MELKEIKDLKEKVIELEFKQELLFDALVSLINDIKPDHDSFAFFALSNGVTFQELKKVDNLLNDITTNEVFYGKYISKDEFVEKFEEIFPRRKDMLVSMVKSFQAEGKHQHICRIILEK